MSEHIVVFVGADEWAELKATVAVAYAERQSEELDALARQIAQAETRWREQPGAAQLAVAAPDLLKALQCYLILDNDLAEDGISEDAPTECERWAECQTLAAEALRKASVELPDWLAGAVLVVRTQTDDNRR